MSPSARRAAVAPLALSAVLASAAPARAEGPYESVVHARPKRDRGEGLVLTQRELMERGANNLAEALDLIPQAVVRTGGRGEFRIDLRGAKQRTMLILVDGVPVDEPYFGSFDLGSIPITDVVEIRVVLQPASPLEGPGGNGGTIEVKTLRATGPRRIEARGRLATSPDALGAVSARVPLGRGFGLRASAGGRYGRFGYPAIDRNDMPVTFQDERHQAHGALRLEHQSKAGLFTLDGFYQHRGFFIPPTEETGADVQRVRSEHGARFVTGFLHDRRPWRVAAGAYSQFVMRETEFYEDFSLSRQTGSQHLTAHRSGAALHLDRKLGALTTLSARASFDLDGATIRNFTLRPVTALAGLAEIAAGVQVNWKWLRADAAIGVAVPAFGLPATPWPEAKLALTVTPNRWVRFQLIGARKGRAPTLRELYDPIEGSRDLYAEQASFVELSAETFLGRWISFKATGYFRRFENLIRLDADRMGFVNFDVIDVRGLETTLEIARGRLLGGGAAYLFADPSSPTLGLRPIENFSHHRVDLWLTSTWKGRLGGWLRLRYQSERVDKLVVLPAFVLMDVQLWARIWRSVRATLRVDNLTNNDYFLRAGLRALGTTVSLAIDGTWE